MLDQDRRQRHHDPDHTDPLPAEALRMTSGIAPRRPGSLLLAITVAGLSLALLASVWLRLNPWLLPALINSWLPPDVIVRELRQPQLSLYGASMERLEIDAAGTRISLRDVSWSWRIDAWLPLRIAPQSMTMRQAIIRLGDSPSRSTAARLPRFWQESWWPMLAVMSIDIDSLQLSTAAAEPLLDAMLAVQNGGQQGSATLQSPVTPALELSWEAVDDAVAGDAWLLQWRSAMPYPAHGVAELRATASGLDWTVQAQAPQWLVQQQWHDLKLQASGSSDLFDGSTALLQAQFAIDGKLTLATREFGWACRGQLDIAQSGDARADIGQCLGTLPGGSIRLDVPLRLEFDDSLALRSIASAAGNVELQGLVLDEVELRHLRLELQAGLLQQIPDAGWTLPRLSFDAVLGRQQSNDSVHLAGTVEQGVLREQIWGATLASTVRIQHGSMALAALELKAKLNGNPQSTQATGSIAHRSIGQLASFDAAINHANARYRASVTLDSRQWQWGEGLVGTLLGADQTLVPAELLRGDVRAAIHIDNDAGPMRIRAKGSAMQLAGTAAGYGIAGLDLEAFSVELVDGDITRFDPLTWKLDSAHAGFGLNRLSGKLLGAHQEWHLGDVSGELLGGRFSLPSFGPLGATMARGEMQLAGIDLAQVARLIDTPGLSLEGKVDATLPLSYSAGAVTVSDGRVRNQGAGAIRYRPPDSAAVAGKEIAMAQRALSNLSLESLDATLQYDAEGKLSLLTEVRGRNPDLDAKRPVHLNLTLETNLRTLLQSMRSGDAVGAWLEKRI